MIAHQPSTLRTISMVIRIPSHRKSNLRNTKQADHRIPEELVEHPTVVDDAIASLGGERCQPTARHRLVARVTHVARIRAEIGHYDHNVTVEAWRQDRASCRSAGFAESANAPEGQVPQEGRLEGIVLE